jgi:hypothetical protein
MQKFTEGNGDGPQNFLLEINRTKYCQHCLVAADKEAFYCIKSNEGQRTSLHKRKHIK